MKTQSVVISVRFLSTIGHLISVLLLFSLYEANVAVSLSDTASSVDIQHAKQQALSALVIAMLCFCVDFSGMFFGTSLFNNSLNMLQIALHFAGSILLSWAIVGVWGYQAFWPITITCNIPTALLELIPLSSIFVFRTQSL